MTKQVIIIGAGGHGKVIADIVLRRGECLLGFLDDNVAKGTVIMEHAVLGGIDTALKYADTAVFVIGIGDNYSRQAIAQKLCGVTWYTAIHPAAVVSEFSTVGAGTVVMAGAVINPCATIGEHCIINTACVVEHDNLLGDFVHISPSGALGGKVAVGELSHIGIGACVKNNVSVCARTIVGAGAAVVKDISLPGVYVGMPARRLK